ncbi:hypothetical protein GHT06_001888 [Daphnia sinensis]|uniref:Uncharacterized protein n=1 Tax=Daphnia sinensis TaxID=1820382 RepID=A0AAD5KTI6_9CRUS|nr:hypothetical protein GHT06_001888 [Daphnia sinensis]
MAVYAEITALMAERQVAFNDALERINELKAKVAAVDQNSDTALSEMEKLNTEYTAAARSFNSRADSDYNSYKSIINDRTDPDATESVAAWRNQTGDLQVITSQIGEFKRKLNSDIIALREKASKNPESPDSKTDEAAKNNNPKDDDEKTETDDGGAKVATTEPVKNSTDSKSVSKSENTVEIVGTRPKKITSDQMAQGDIIPGKRTYNPLSQLSSYNYILSLYMVTPDVINAFTLRGRKELNLSSVTGENGIYLIAQSGGKPAGVSTAKELENDIYIDNLKFESPLGAVYWKGPTFSSGKLIEFQIIEPYGSSFPNRLAAAAAALKKNYKGSSDYASNSGGVMRQYFIMSISFFGYDSSGELIKSDRYASIDTGREGNATSVFDKYLDLYISNMNYRLDGRTTVYNVQTAGVDASAAYGVKWGRLNSPYTLTAATVGDAITQLTDNLSKEEEKRNELGKDKMEKTEYSIIFESDTIKKSKLIDEKQFKSKDNSGTSGVKKSADSTEAASEKAGPDKTQRKISLQSNISVLQAIQNIIIRSEYITKAFASLNTDDLTAEDVKMSESKRTPTEELKWFTIQPSVIIKGRDKVRNDWTYDIRYIIKEYAIPYVTPPFNELVKSKVGMFKSYDYWYTGKNTEILSFEHDVNNAWINAMLIASDQQEDTNKQDVPRHMIKEKGDSSIAVDKTAQAVNIVQTSLYTPGTFSNVRFTVMGDPDFIFSNAELNLSPEITKDSNTVNPSSSQQFCRIKFNTTEDYVLSDGLMKPNPVTFFTKKILPDQKSSRGDDQIWVRLDSVTHSFSGGKFTQELRGAQIEFDWKTTSNGKSSNASERDEVSSTEDRGSIPKTETQPVVAPTGASNAAKPTTKADDDAMPKANYSNEGRNYMGPSEREESSQKTDAKNRQSSD